MPAVEAPSRPPLLARSFAWAGGALFVVALLFFLYRYLGAFGELRVGAPSLTVITVDLLLFTAFALHHSAFAREPVRRAVARIVTPGLERSAYVWVASLLFMLVCAAWLPVGGPPVWDATGMTRWFLHALQLLGGVLAVGSAATIGVWELAGISAPRQEPESDATTEIRAAGPYRWVRHPIYTGWFLLVFTAVPMTPTRLLFAVVSGVYTLIGIAFEERSLRASTAGAYDTYARQVRWRLVPGVY
jgi:protein-S-isoprenylcysteine O-methyltransferase Ste14